MRNPFVRRAALVAGLFGAVAACGPEDTDRERNAAPEIAPGTEAAGVPPPIDEDTTVAP